MSPLLNSLRVRWLIVALLALLLSLAAAGVLITRSFEHAIERERASDLEATLRRLAAQIDPELEPPIGSDRLSDPRYDTPLSGLYWQVEDLERGATYRSRSLWDASLPPPGVTGVPVVVGGPGGESLIALSSDITLVGAAATREFRITVAEPRDDPDLAASKFEADIVATLSAVGLALAAAAAVQLWLGLQPLKRLVRAVEDVRAGRADRVGGVYPVEIEPLPDALNALLTAHEQSLLSARHRAADLAHGLQTPVAVLKATAERMREAGDKANADTIELLTAEMSERVAFQLKLARLRPPNRAQRPSSSLNQAILRSVAVLRKSERGERLNWRVELAQQIEVGLDAHDLMELVGVLLENACKWAGGLVQVRAQVRDATAELVVEDDGQGLGDDEIEQLGLRGVRLDQSMPGHGLGLAIAFEIVRLNEGTIELSRSGLGGLAARVALPPADTPVGR